MPAQQLFTNGIINQAQRDTINEYERTKPMSVHWELRTILYLGILLFTSGIGILIYKNIDTIGHQAILALVLLSCGGCFYYAHKNNLPYTHEEAKHTSPLFHYVVLLGCLLFGVFVGYLQYQYSVFGTHYGLATLVPTLIFFTAAYWFDNKSVLSLGISGLAAWAGLTVTPLQLLQQNNFSTTTIVFTGITLGLLMALMGYMSEHKHIKKHFAFSYHNFAINLLCIATLGALFSMEFKLVSLFVLCGVCTYYIKYAIASQSFLFLLLGIVYSYIGITYVLFTVVLANAVDIALVTLAPMYIMLSCFGIVQFFLKYKRILKLN
jgi:hypothetical protein